MKKQFFNLESFIERPMSNIGKDKYVRFLSENESKVLKHADLGIYPIVDNNKDIISWGLQIDPENTKLNYVDKVIDFGEFGKLTLPIIEFENEEIQNNGTRKVKKGFSFRNVDNLIISKFLQAAFELFSLVHEFEPQHRGLMKEFRHNGHLVKDAEGFPLLGYAFLESYYGITKSNDPMIQKNVWATSDIKRFTKGNMTLYIESKKNFYKSMVEALETGNISLMYSDEKEMGELIGKDTFSIIDKDSFDISKMYQGTVSNNNSYANKFASPSTLQLDSMIATGLANNNENVVVTKAPKNAPSNAPLMTNPVVETPTGNKATGVKVKK